MTAILPKELLTATLGGLSLLVVSGGSDGDVLVQQSDGTYAPETLVTGDVFGPASSTDNAIARFDATTGKLLQNCVVTIGDTGNIAGLGTVSCGAITASGTIDIGNAVLTQAYGLRVGNGVSYGSDYSYLRFTTNWGNVDVKSWGGRLALYGSGVSEVDAPQFAIDSTGRFAAASGTAFSASHDTTISRSSAGVWQMGTTSNNALGSLLLTNLTASGNISGVAGSFITLGVSSGTSTFYQVQIAAGNSYLWNGRSQIASPSDGVVAFKNNAGSADAALTCGAITASGLVCMSIYTVATLPSASANAYKEANVSDALAPAMGVAVVGGGSVKTKVRSNGTDWTVCGI